MTEKLYYCDPFLKEFSGVVISCREEKNGWTVVLDRTAFYPEGGGQPADHGVLGDVLVTDTREKDGVIVHTCNKPLTEGKQVIGKINWDRRFDHMQQHSGEHIVSGMICSRYHCDNVGFHMGHDVVTIDFNADVPPEDLPEIEAAANAYIWGNTAIDIRFLSGEALEQAEYRSKKFIPGEVRLVAFPGADCCACCGTHVLSAAQVGFVKLLSCQKFREGVRIEMVCGGRATAYLSGVLEQNTKISRTLSAKPMETATAVERLQKELYEARGRIAELEERDFQRKAEACAGAGDVLLVETDMPAESVRKLCDAVLNSCGGRCAVFAGGNSVFKYAVGMRDGDVRELVKEMNKTLNGRGGGKPNFAQGSVNADETAIRAFFQNYAETPVR